MLIPVIALAQERGYRISLTAAGPARDIWRQAARRWGGAVREVDVAAAFDPLRPDLLVTGTSFCDFERSLWARARKRGIGSVAAVDAWTNLERRFDGPEGSEQPNALCVVDEPMRDEIATAGWCCARLHVTGHPHLQSTARHLRKARAGRLRTIPPVVAFFSEPVRQDHGGIEAIGYDQFRIVNAISTGFPGERPVMLVIQPHPREDPADWREWLQEIPLPDRMTIMIGDGGTEALLSRCDMTLGMHSMVLIEASLAGIPALAVQLGRKRVINPVVESIFGIRVVTEQGDLSSALIECLEPRETHSRKKPNIVSIIDCADERTLAAVNDELNRKR